MKNFLTEPDAQLFGTEETPSESSTEKEPEKEPASETEQTDKEPAGQGESGDGTAQDDLSSKSVPYKRLKEVVDQRNVYRDKYEALLEQQATVKADAPQTQTSTAKPEWFKKYFGDDDEAWQGFQGMTSTAKEEAKREALQEIETKQTEAQETAKRANEWVEEQVSSLKETEGDFDRNALFKVMDKYRPTDDQGNLDFKAGLEILRLQPAETKEKSQARRKLADKLNSSSGKTEPSTRSYVTRADLQRMGGWDSVNE